MTSSTAVVLAPLGVGGALRALIERLTDVGIEVSVVDDLPSAAEIARRRAERPPCVLLDLRDLAPGQIEDVRRAAHMIRRTIAMIPLARPIAITAEADAALIVACMRAGAGDVLDFQLEGTANAPAVVQRVCGEQSERAYHVHAATALREMIEELLKDLIRTERRSIDLEEKLAAGSRAQTLAEGREPAILLVEHEREVADELAEQLEAAGIATYAYLSGEEALREAEVVLAAGGGFDLALVAAELPGIDGIATVSRLRAHLPGLPAFLMTARHDEDLAARAADLGVVGFVHKPLEDVGLVVSRLAQLARDALQRTREHLYLDRIKERHEHVLARYRSLPRPP